MAFSDVGVRAVVKGFSQYQAQMGMMESSTKKFGGFLKTGLKVAAVVGAVAVGLSIKAFADFDAEMTKSLAIMTDVSDKMRDDMAKAARKMALETTFSAKDAAESYFFLASAGLDAEQSIAALPVVAAFAQAGMFDMALATDLLTDAQSALGLSSSDTAENMENMTRVGDVLVKMNQMANASVEQFATSLKEKGASALRGANIALEEGAGLLAYWADQGLKGSAAGSQLAGMLLMLPKIAVKNADAFKRYGIELFDSSGKLKSFSDIAREFTPMLEGMSDAQRAQAFEQMGINRLLADSILKMKGGADAIDKYTDAAWDAAGATKEVAEKQLKTFNAQLSLLMSHLTDFAITIGSMVVPALVRFMRVLMEKVIPALKEWWAEHGPAITKFLRQDLLPVLADLGNFLKSILVPAIDTLHDAWDNLRPVLEKLGSVLERYVLPALQKVGQFLMEHKPLMVAIAAAILLIVAPWLAVVAAIVLVLAKWDEISQMFTKTIPDAIDRLLDWIGKIPIVGQVLEVWLEGLVVFWTTTWNVMVNAVETVFKLIKNRIETALKVIRGVFNTFKALFSGDWEEAWNSLKQIFIDIWEGLKNEIGTVLTGIVGHFDALWGGITSGARAMRDNLFAILNKAIEIIEGFLQQFADLYNQTIGRLGRFMPGLPEEITVSLGRVGGAADKAGRKLDRFNDIVYESTQTVEGSLAAYNAETAVFRRLGREIEGAGNAAAGAGFDMDEFGESAGGAGGAADDAAESTLSLRAALELTSDMFYTAAGAANDLAYANVEASDLMKIQIGLLEDRLSVLDSAGEAEGLLADAIRITIQHLEDQIAAFDESEERMILFGEDAVGPVSAAFRDMVEAISEAESALSGLISVQTEEEADLQARISYWELEAEKIDQVAGELRGLTDMEEIELGVKESRLRAGEKALEILRDEIEELERKLEVEDKLTTKEAGRLRDAKEEAIALEENIEKLEDRIKTLKDLAKVMTSQGKLAKKELDDIEDTIDALEDQADELKATKKAYVDEQNALIRGRPTIQEWIDDIIGMGIETGLYGQEMENIPPLLEEWWRTHGTMGFEIARTQNNLLLAQRTFVSESIAAANEWGDAWVGAAQNIVDAMAAAAGGEPAGESYQYGGYVRRTGMAFLHAGEFVLPKYRVEHVWDRVAAPRAVVSAAPAAPGGGGFTANIAVTSQQETAREIARTMRSVAFGLRGTP